MRKLLITISIELMAIIVISSFSLPSFSVVAQISNPSWQISITGLVSNPINFTLAQLATMPQTTISANLYCVDAPSIAIEGGDWQGVELWTLLTQAGISSSATKIAFRCIDGFSTDLTVDAAKSDSIIVAYTLNSGAITEVVRLVVPGHYGYKWADQITNIVAVNYDYLGTYESQGYPDDGLLTSTGLPPAPTPYIPYPPSVTPITTASPQPSSGASPTTLSPSPSTSSPTFPKSPRSSIVTQNLEIVGIIVAILIAVSGLTLFLKRRQNNPGSNPKNVQFTNACHAALF